MVWTHSKNTDCSPSSVGEVNGTLLGTTHANRAIHTNAASTMNPHIDANGGLVSNPSDREIQGSSALAAHAAALDLDVGNFSWSEPHVA